MLAHLRTYNIYKRTYGTTRFSMMHEEAKRRKLDLTMMYNKKEIEISHGPRNDDPKTPKNCKWFCEFEQFLVDSPVRLFT